MSNQSSSGFGFIPVKHRDGREYAGSGGTPCYVPASDSTALYVGDPVVLVGGSTIDTNIVPITAALGETGSAVGLDIGTIPAVTLATAGTSNLIYGIVTHIGYDPYDCARPSYRKASVAAVVFVETDVDVVYQARVINYSTALAASTNLFGTTASLYLPGGTSATGASGAGIDGSTLQTSSGTTYQIRLMGLARDLLNSDASAANPVVLCMINQSSEASVALTAV